MVLLKLGAVFDEIFELGEVEGKPFQLVFRQFHLCVELEIEGSDLGKIDKGVRVLKRDVQILCNDMYDARFFMK